jgi:hypothetical protein
VYSWAFQTKATLNIFKNEDENQTALRAAFVLNMSLKERMAAFENKKEPAVDRPKVLLCCVSARPICPFLFDIASHIFGICSLQPTPSKLRMTDSSAKLNSVVSTITFMSWLSSFPGLRDSGSLFVGKEPTTVTE